MGALPAGGPGVASAIREVGTDLVHELKTGKIFGLPGFDKGLSQAHDARGVAFGGVDSLLFRRQYSARTARQQVDWLTAGLPKAASQIRSSSSVASGCWRRQTSSCWRAGPSSWGAGPLRGASAANAPVVRWRRSSFSTNETETLNWAATAANRLPG